MSVMLIVLACWSSTGECEQFRALVPTVAACHAALVQTALELRRSGVDEIVYGCIPTREA